MSVNTLHGEELVARARAWQNAAGNQNAEAKYYYSQLAKLAREPGRVGQFL
ncbi:Uncharacterised protein [Mycobacteroides abscessus subsp. abscessus]|nr:Uncharacterised protein [Mycobacteroides abscessus subsp. abscessus]